MAVWALRAGCIGLIIGISGLLTNRAGGTPWVLLVGAVIWIVSSAVTLTGAIRARNQIGLVRPWFWKLRFWLISDSLRRRNREPRDLERLNASR